MNVSLIPAHPAPLILPIASWSRRWLSNARGGARWCLGVECREGQVWRVSVHQGWVHGCGCKMKARQCVCKTATFTTGRVYWHTTNKLFQNTHVRYRCKMDHRKSKTVYMEEKKDEGEKWGTLRLTPCLLKTIVRGIKGMGGWEGSIRTLAWCCQGASVQLPPSTPSHTTEWYENTYHVRWTHARLSLCSYMCTKKHLQEHTTKA